MENKKFNPLIIILLIVLLLGIFFVVIIKEKKKDTKEEEQPVEIDVSDANNVPSIDSKLGLEDIKITHGYLLSYTKRKSGIWYRSNGRVKSIKYDGNIAIITLTDDDNDIVCHISKDRVNVKKGDHVYFVGTIDISDEVLNLARIDTEEINYNSATDIEFTELSLNMYNLKNTYFIVSGYMVTVTDKYKLYASKEAYKKEETVGNYFLIEWRGDFNYTGNQYVTLKCSIGDTYKLVGCSIEE